MLYFLPVFLGFGAYPIDKERARERKASRELRNSNGRGVWGEQTSFLFSGYGVYLVGVLGEWYGGW